MEGDRVNEFAVEHALRAPLRGAGVNAMSSVHPFGVNRRGAALVGIVSMLLAACAGSPSPAKAPAASAGSVSAAPADASALPANVVVSVEPWTLESKDGKIITTLSYRILTTATRTSITDRIPVFMEAALIHYTTALGALPRPDGLMDTYLMANRPQWARMTQRFMGEQADTYLQIQRGGFASGGKAILYDIGPRDTFAIAAHEGWHQYSQRTFKNPLPVTLEEGVATYMEGFRWISPGSDEASRLPTFMPWSNWERYEQLRQAERNGKLVPLDKLMRSTPQELMAGDPDNALVYYAQVWALIHFLNEDGAGQYRGALKEMLSDAAAGRLIPKIQRELGSRAAGAYSARRGGVDLLALYTGRSAAALDGDYQLFIKAILKTGSRGKIVAGKSPLSADDP
jgi:hypothetical protein